MSRLRRPSRSVLMVAVVLLALAAAIAASGCDVGGDPPAGEADATAAGEPSARVSDEELPAPDPSDDEDTAPPEIVAVCNTWLDPTGHWQHPATPADCREEGAAGLRTGSGWGLAVLREGGEGGSVEYRYGDGSIVRPGETSERNAFAALAPGAHTIAVREERASGWTDWSAPYAFTTVHELEIFAVCNARWDPELDQLQQPTTGAECQNAAAVGLRTGSGWDWQPYMRGIVELANVTYRFDGGAGFGAGPGGSAAFTALAPGHHTIEARERRPWGWTDWSAPHEFETVAVLEVIAICNSRAGDPRTYHACKEAEREGFDRSTAWWVILADGVVEWENVVYRFDGGEATSQEDIEDLWALAPGQHVVEIRERRSWGWTDWSPPYTFAIVR